MNRQQRTLRRDTSVFAEAALDEESTATRVESQSYRKTVTQRTSQLETVGFTEEAPEQGDWGEPSRGTRARNLPKFFEIRTHLAVTEGDYVERKTVEAEQGGDWDQWHQAMKTWSRRSKTTRLRTLWNHPQTDVIPGLQTGLQVKLGPNGQLTNTKHPM